MPNPISASQFSGQRMGSPSLGVNLAMPSAGNMSGGRLPNLGTGLFKTLNAQKNEQFKNTTGMNSRKMFGRM